jgi:hypothetical protein
VTPGLAFLGLDPDARGKLPPGDRLVLRELRLEPVPDNPTQPMRAASTSGRLNK